VNAIKLLKKDHEVVADLFERVKDTTPSKHPALFTKIKAELDVHAHIEETVFYPKLEKDGKKDIVDITLEGIEEHHQIKLFLKELAAMKGGGDTFEAKLKVLIEDVEHHVKEEEDNMFPMVEDQFTEATLEKLGAAMEKKKKIYIASHAIAKNLVKRTADQKIDKGMLDTIYEKAITFVEEIFTGKDEGGRPAGRKTGKKGNGKTAGKTGVGARSASNGTKARKVLTSKRTAAGPKKAATSTTKKASARAGQRAAAK
jgi:iron-sulfur cluster repair protein YtfE (RIC family)